MAKKLIEEQPDSVMLPSGFILKTGSSLSEEHREKISKAKKGNPLSEEHRENIGKSAKGKKPSKEHRQNQRVSAIKYIEKTKLMCSLILMENKR